MSRGRLAWIAVGVAIAAALMLGMPGPGDLTAAAGTVPPLIFAQADCSARNRCVASCQARQASCLASCRARSSARVSGCEAHSACVQTYRSCYYACSRRQPAQQAGCRSACARQRSRCESKCVRSVRPNRCSARCGISCASRCPPCR